MIRRAITSALFILAMVSTAAAEKRVALVVGNGLYQNIAALDNPTKDAALVADTLKSLGFSIVGDAAQLNLDKAGLDQAIQKFGAAVQGADVAMFFYAGHGVQVRGANFLVPINANPTREADVDFQMTDLNLVLNQMQDTGTRLNVVVLDACRNNPFGSRGLRSSEGGLAQIRAPEGTLISYATQPGNVAQDGTDGHSPYSRALAETMKRTGLDIFQTFNQVGLNVKRATGGAQQPWVSSSPIDGSFYFAGGPANTGQASVAPEPARQETSPPPPARQDEPTRQEPSRPPPAQQEARLQDAAKPLPEGITDCDRFAANPSDSSRIRGVPGVKQSSIDVASAAQACNAAQARYPGVARFMYQAGRVAFAQKDYALSRQLFEKAVAANYPAANFAIGSLYANGLGVPRDYRQARQWFDKGSAANDPISMNAIGRLYDQGHGAARDGAMAKQWYDKAIAAGSILAIGNLGRLYLAGNGVPRDAAKARALFEKGAAEGDPRSMNWLGLIYQDGSGVPVDLVEARRWFERSAAGGNSYAMNNLGRQYFDGLGVKKDYTQAKYWFEKAAAGGRPTAMLALGDIYLYGYGVEKDKVQARNWFEKADAVSGAAAGRDGGEFDEDRKR